MKGLARVLENEIRDLLGGFRELLEEVEHHFRGIESVNRITDANHVERIGVRNPRKRPFDFIKRTIRPELLLQRKGHPFGVSRTREVIEADFHIQSFPPFISRG